MPTKPTRLYLAIEFIALFIALPCFCYLGWIPIYIIVVLMAAGLFCLIVLLFDPEFERKRLWNPTAIRGQAPRTAAIFIGAAVVLTGAVFVLDRPSFLRLAREHTGLWALIMTLYPLLSVYPQEIIYRVFLFHRYRMFFTTARSRILISALVFGVAHIVFRNPFAVPLTLAAGLLFASTYARTKSLATVWLEHAMYGCLIFTVGLGKFFYLGTMKLAETMLH